MQYDKKILSDLLREQEARREERARTIAAHCQEVYAHVPRIREIDTILRTTAAAVLRTALESGDDPTLAVSRLRDQNLQLQHDRTRLLLENGYAADYLDGKPDCPVCNDLGYLGAAPCECLKKRYARRLTEQLSTILPIEDQNFESFRMDYYPDVSDSRMGLSPRENMEYNFETCRSYAKEFGAQAQNLLFFGSTGLGKTFLSTCIAKKVCEAGFSVAYDTATRVLGSYEAAKFGGPELAAAQSRIRKYEQSDLFILDDLGTEMSTAFTTSALYSLLNTRLMTRRPMIVNTNLLPVEFEKRYSAAISSRLLGDFTPLRFFGDDIRPKKRRESGR